jgi:hypothetical protein
MRTHETVEHILTGNSFPRKSKYITKNTKSAIEKFEILGPVWLGVFVGWVEAGDQ